MANPSDPKHLNFEELKRKLAAARAAADGRTPDKNELAGRPPSQPDKNHSPDALAQTIPSVDQNQAPTPPTPQAGAGRGAATAPLGPGRKKPLMANGDGLIPIEADSDLGIQLFGLRIDRFTKVIGENKARILKSHPKIQNLYFTLKLEKEKFTLLGIEPPELRAVLEKEFNSALEALSGDVRGKDESRGFKCRFEYTLIWNTSVLEAPKAPSQPPESDGIDPNKSILGGEGKALIADGNVPMFRQMCKPHPLPGQNGYVFVAYGKDNGVPTMRMYEIRMEKENDFHYFLGVYKVQDDKKVPVDEKNPLISVSKAGEPERYALVEEGLEITISVFKGGVRSIRVDPLRLESESAPANPGYDQEIAAGIVGAGAAAALAFLPQLSSLLGIGSVPESVAVGSLMLPVQQFLGIAAAAVVAVDSVSILLGIRGKPGKK